MQESTKRCSAHSHDICIDLPVLLLLPGSLHKSSASAIRNKLLLFPSFDVLNHNGFIVYLGVAKDAFRSGPAYSPSDPGLGRFVAQSIEVFEEGEAILRPISSGLPDLEDLVDRAERQKDLNKAFVAPVRRVPPELLSQIFLIVVADSHLLRLHEVRLCRSFARVCHAWRELALATPQLWSNVSFWLNGSDNWQNLFARELQLTRDRPIDVTLQQPLGDRQPTRSWAILASQSNRWRALTVYLAGGALQHINPQPLVCSSLVSISFKDPWLKLGRSENTNDNTRMLFSMLEDAPLLRTVEIRVATARGSYRMCLPSSWRLSALLVQFGYCEDVRRLLPMVQQYSRTLETLDFAIGRTEPGLMPLGPGLSLPQLTELICGTHGSQLIRHVKAPKLRFLHIVQHLEDLCNAPFPDILSTAQYVSCFKSLRELHLRNVSWSTDSLIDTLNELTNLECLRMLESGHEYSGKLVTRELFERLTRGGVDADDKVIDHDHLCPLPNLTTMTVTVHCPVAEDDALIPAARRMALSRAKVEGERLVRLAVFSFRYRMSQDSDRWTSISLELL
ncbi:uncharacterized protein SCHCODRAFT_02725950 [Schizophyllum commune H4-8]|nr:uncharacterized protein SCHCODRAFT_02725950 [Schizophyllum commune H4-8]KAI5897248.1 hypothetical protein SCHCODRAFT_02725950 [Schizophyllum commune H4-8]